MLFRVLFAVAAVAAAAPARADLIDFENLTTPPNQGDLAVPAGFAGFQWNNFYALDATYWPNSGYQNTLPYGNKVAFAGWSNPASFESATPFNFLSAVLTPGWFDNVDVTVNGYLGNALIYSVTNTLSSTAATPLTFNFNGVTKVEFLRSGGTPHGWPQDSNTQLAIDNVLVTPAPAGLVLGLVGAGAMLGLRRRRA